MLYAYKISTQTKAHVFFEYAAHVNKIDIQIYENGWNRDHLIHNDKGIYLDDDMHFETTSEEELDEAITTLKHLYWRNKK